MNDQHRTVSRLVGILEFIAGRPKGATLTEVADHLGAARSTVHGFLRGLVFEGYLEEHESGGYVFGRGAHLLLIQKSESLLHILEPVLEQITDRFNETVTLAVQVGRKLSYIASRQSTQRIVYLPTMHTRRPLWPTSAGKIFLAALSDTDIGELVYPVDLRQVISELERVRSSGFAFNRGETVADVSAVAIGIGDANQVTAAITVGGPHVRIEPVFDEIVAQLQRSVTDAGLKPFSFENY